MTSQDRKIARRRARARQLREEGLSFRDIAKALRVTSSTVTRDLAEPAPERPLPAPPAANQRAAKSGATGHGPAYVELADKHLAALRERFPGLDDERAFILADRMARFDLGRAWLAEQGTVVRDSEGHTFDISDRVEKWGSRIEQMLGELEEEGKAHREATERPGAAGVDVDTLALDPELADAAHGFLRWVAERRLSEVN